MTNPLKPVDIPDEIQRRIVGAALSAAADALRRGHEPDVAAIHARTVVEAGVRAWRSASGITS